MNERPRDYLRPFELDPTTAELVPDEPQAVPAEPQDELPQARRSRLWGRLSALGLLAAIAAVTLHTIDGLITRIRIEPLIGWPLAILMALVAIAALGVFGREWVQLRRLRHRAHLRDEAQRLAGSELHGRAPALIDDVEGGLPQHPLVRGALARYRRHADDSLADGERLRLFERNVMTTLDERAYRLVLHSARDIGLLTAISPYGLLDGMLVLWRTTLMIRAVARLYGIAPGPTATAALLRRCLRNAALAGIADVATHAVLEHAGASLAALLSARAGQGAGNALLAAKLGIEAIKETRPLAFIEAAPPSLRQVRNALLSSEPKAMDSFFEERLREMKDKARS
jgi:putative membrane protein